MQKQYECPICNFKTIDKITYNNHRNIEEYMKKYAAIRRSSGYLRFLTFNEATHFFELHLKIFKSKAISHHITWKGVGLYKYYYTYKNDAEFLICEKV